MVVSFSYNLRVLHNYVIWRLVMDLMPHMPPQYEKTRARFRKVLLGIMTDRSVFRSIEFVGEN